MRGASYSSGDSSDPGACGSLVLPAISWAMSERPDIDQIKAELADAVVRLLAGRDLTDAAAGGQIGITAGDIALIREGKIRGLSVDRLIEILNALDQRVEVK